MFLRPHFTAYVHVKNIFYGYVKFDYLPFGVYEAFT